MTATRCETTWREITSTLDERAGYRLWTATVTRACPWDAGDTIEHQLLVSYEAERGALRYLWQTVIGQWAGENIDGCDYTATLDEAKAAAEAHLADQPNIGITARPGPAIIVSPSTQLRGSPR